MFSTTESTCRVQFYIIAILKKPAIVGAAQLVHGDLYLPDFAKLPISNAVAVSECDCILRARRLELLKDFRTQTFLEEEVMSLIAAFESLKRKTSEGEVSNEKACSTAFFMAMSSAVKTFEPLDRDQAASFSSCGAKKAEVVLSFSS